MQTLGVRTGEAVEIIGRRHTAGTAVPPYQEDEGLEIVRLDGLQRANAGATAGERLEILRADVRPAARVTLAPAQKNIRLAGSGEGLRRTFFGRPLVAGDVVSTSVYQRAAAPGGIPDEVFQQLLAQQSYALQEIRLIVVSTNPKGVVRIDETTEIELLPQYTEPKEGRRADVTYDDIGGLGSAIEQVREMVELPLRHPELFQRLGIVDGGRNRRKSGAARKAGTRFADPFSRPRRRTRSQPDAGLTSCCQGRQSPEAMAEGQP
jgi:transitional endoplasmic reticulum ATPase